MECQPDNGINIKPFEGEECDRELYKLYPFLQKLNEVKKTDLMSTDFQMDRLEMFVQFQGFGVII